MMLLMKMQGTAILAVLGIIYAAIIAFIAIIIRKNSKNWKDIMNIISSSEAQKQLKVIFNQITKAAQADKNLKKYNKYLKWKNYQFKSNNVKLDTNNSEKRQYIRINFDAFSVDIDKVFKDLYGVTAKEYDGNYSETQPDNCRPAPKFDKFIKDLNKDLSLFIKNIKNKDFVKIDLSIYDNGEDYEFFYDTYYNGSEEIIGDLKLYIDYEKIMEKSKTL